MHSVVRAALILLVLTSLILVVPAGAMPPGTESYNVNKADVRNCETALGEDQNRTIAYDGPVALWPPSHDYYDKPVHVVVSGLATDYINVSAVAGHNQIDNEGMEFLGSGNTDADITPSTWTADGPSSLKSPTYQMRSERSGWLTTDGRTYFIKVNASFNGISCATETFEIRVPHDMSIDERT